MVSFCNSADSLRLDRTIIFFSDAEGAALKLITLLKFLGGITASAGLKDIPRAEPSGALTAVVLPFRKLGRIGCSKTVTSDSSLPHQPKTGMVWF